MKFTISKQVFLDGLRQVASVVSSKTTLPILSNVKIEAENGQCIILVVIFISQLPIAVSNVREARRNILQMFEGYASADRPVSGPIRRRDERKRNGCVFQPNPLAAYVGAMV